MSDTSAARMCKFPTRAQNQMKQTQTHFVEHVGVSLSAHALFITWESALTQTQTHWLCVIKVHIQQWLQWKVNQMTWSFTLCHQLDFWTESCLSVLTFKLFTDSKFDIKLCPSLCYTWRSSAVWWSRREQRSCCSWTLMDGPWLETAAGVRAPLWLSWSRARAGRAGLRRWPSRPRCVLICDDRRLLIWPCARASYSSAEVFLYLEETDGYYSHWESQSLLTELKSLFYCFGFEVFIYLEYLIFSHSN